MNRLDYSSLFNPDPGFGGSRRALRPGVDLVLTSESTQPDLRGLDLSLFRMDSSTPSGDDGRQVQSRCCLSAKYSCRRLRDVKPGQKGAHGCSFVDSLWWGPDFIGLAWVSPVSRRVSVLDVHKEPELFLVPTDMFLGPKAPRKDVAEVQTGGSTTPAIVGLVLRKKRHICSHRRLFFSTRRRH